MSFSSEVKAEMINIKTEEQCCIHALAYGLALFGRTFSKTSISLLTENENVANCYAKTIEKISGAKAETSISRSGKVTVKFIDKQLKVLDCFGYTGKELTIRINRANIENDCCTGAFLRGAFLSCGFITDPSKNYHLEFVLSHFNICKDLMRILEEIDLKPKYTTRKGSYIVYFKDSKNIEDLLTHMGATNSALEFMGAKIYKDVRNRVNRRVNFESANSDRTFNAAMEQIEAIEKLKKNNMFGQLNDEMQELAKLRVENPEMSLRELGETLSKPISRSGVNHRLQKFIEMADSIG